MIKQQFGLLHKVRYKGLSKNASQLQVMFALANLWRVRKRLLELTGDVRLPQGQAGRLVQTFPSSDKYIAGTARSIDNQALPDAGSGGGGVANPGVGTTIRRMSAMALAAETVQLAKLGCSVRHRMAE